MTVSPLPRQSSVLLPCELGLLIELDRSMPRRVHIRGELDIATSPLLARALDRAAEACTDIEVDLSGLTFCDVVGLTALEQAHRRLAGRGCRLTLHGTWRLHLLLRVPGLFTIPCPTGTALPLGCRQAPGRARSVVRTPPARAHRNRDDADR